MLKDLQLCCFICNASESRQVISKIMEDNWNGILDSASLHRKYKRVTESNGPQTRVILPKPKHHYFSASQCTLLRTNKLVK